MKRLLVITMIVGALAGCKSSKVGTGTMDGNMNQSSTKGWTSLFDGKTTTGWHQYGITGAQKTWIVSDGTLTPDESIKGGHGDLVTDKEYGNFDMSLEWKISKNGNSGIIFFVHEDAMYKETYQTGLEMQVLDNDGHPDGKIIKHRAGDLYDLISVSKETVKPVGEWNKAEIKNKDGKLDLYLNGEHVVSTMLWDANWKSMVANSKFKPMPAFGTYNKGKIALQYHGDKVWFKNIKVKEL